MDPGSGVFTCPIAGSYLFIVHVCSADMHKALLSIRYFQNNIHLLFFKILVLHTKIYIFRFYSKIG